MTRLRLAFLGTPEFSVPTLEALIAAGHEVAAVYSQPPRPSGRGHRVQPSPVHRAAAAHGIEVRTPKTLRDENEQAAFRALALDAAIVVAYGLILPKAILDAPKFGCFNLHASLLPRWRGAAPIHRAIMAGDRESGVMVMRMEEGLDTGPVLATYRCPIDDATTTGALHDELAREGASLMVKTLPAIADGSARDVVQPDAGVTYAKKISAEEARIDWTKSAHDVLRHIHGLNPSPGAWCLGDQQRLKILRVAIGNGRGVPGEVLDGQLTVACGEGAVRVLEAQRAGREAQSAEALLRGYAVGPGSRLV